MNNVMLIDGHKAVVNFDPDIAMFRGDFLGAERRRRFYASDVEGLQREGALPLRTFLDVCSDKGITLNCCYSSKFFLRVDPEMHEAVALAAASHGINLNLNLNQSAVATLGAVSRVADSNNVLA
ncbi:type II toxin-antitoxin system HicB family antitoxin [Novosphingobium sp.]|uniref:type II toxin-antitoxin system HicB family antitoxin n=1 Tax=Novosphingobium sp. TaxID=1874826 RepID=UPI003B51E54D